MTAPQYILHHGRTYPVAAKVRSNGVECVAIMIAPKKPHLIPLTQAVQAPARSRPVLATINGERV
jgi:hypothetical protein